MTSVTQTATGPPEALRELNQKGPVMREVLKHINGRPIEGWTLFKVKGQTVHLRLLSLAPVDHMLLIVREQDCVNRYVYPESLETTRRRIYLKLPDLVIQHAGPPAAESSASAAKRSRAASLAD